MIQNSPGPVIPQRYIDALAGRDPLELSSKAPKRVKRLIEGLSNKELEWRPAPGKWSIKEVLAHLADGEVVLGARIRMVAAMDRPTIVGYDQDAFVARLGVDQVSAEQYFDEWRAVREVNTALVSRLPRESFSKVGMHTERGEESLGAMVQMYAGHDVIHEQQIAELVAGYKADRKARHAAKAAQKEQKKLAARHAEASKKKRKKSKAK